MDQEPLPHAEYEAQSVDADSPVDTSRKITELAILGISLVPVTFLTLLFFFWLMISFESHPPGYLLLPVVLLILCIPMMGFCLGIILTEKGKAGRMATRAVLFFPALVFVLSVVVFIFEDSLPDSLDFLLVLSFLLLFGGPAVGIMLCLMALKEVKRSEKKVRVTFLAGIGLTENILIFLFFVILPGAAPSKESPRRCACVNNLKQIGLIMNIYSGEQEGQYPPIDNVRNNFIFDANVLYPAYLTDCSIPICPSDPEFEPGKNFWLTSTEMHPDFDVGDFHPDCVTDASYCYLGWLVTSDEEAEAFFEAYDRLYPEDFGKDIIVPYGRGIGGGNVIPRLERGIEGLLDDPSIDASKIPIVWDTPSLDISNFSHVPAGFNVLYLDGHTEFIRYPGKFPVSETMARLLDERARDPIPDCE